MANNPGNNASVIYPFNKEAIKLSKNYKNGNFGLWFNKFIPINGEKNTAIDLYNDTYENVLNSNKLQYILNNKHYSQYSFYKSYEGRYEAIIITAELISPLITGIGQTHPNEVGMTFDHTLGIPYIPASSIKGIARFSHSLNLLEDLRSEKHYDEIKKDKNDEECFDDEAEWTNISTIFGRGGNKHESNIGNVIFLDAYPESVPKLTVDIMNPHYGDYYSGKTPPADYLNPVPIKFLTIAKHTKFIFRAVINKAKLSEFKVLVVNAIKKALTEEGVGAKTAVGYGMFKIEGNDEPESVKKLIKEKERERESKIEEFEKNKKIKEINNMPKVDGICYELSNNYDEKRASEIYGALDSYNEEDKIKIAKKLKEAYIKAKKWDKKDKLSSKQEEKIKKIKLILNE